MLEPGRRDVQARDGDRELEAARAGAARIEIEHALACFGDGLVRVSRDDGGESRRGGIDVELGEIVQQINVVRADLDDLSERQRARPFVAINDWEVDDKADAKQKWVRIRHGNRDGYLPEEHVRSPIEQAACFVKSGNGWRMTGFAPAGGE